MADRNQRHDGVLQVRGLTTRLNTARGALRAVDNLDLTVDQGECVGVVGESGSGKSILMRSIMGIQPPSAEVTGDVSFGGVDLHELSPSQLRDIWGPQIAMVFQDPMTSLNPVRRIGQQITDPIRRHMLVSRREAQARAEQLLKQVGIPEPRRRLRQFPHELSGGMRQRIGIAIALSCEPQLLIADEPTTALDVTVQKQIVDLLGDIRRTRRMSLILVTHDLSVVAGRTDRVLVMYAGRVVEAASTLDLFDHPQHPYTRALLAAIPRLDATSHTPLQAIAGHPPDMTRPPTGCRYAARCSRMQDICRHQPPPVVAAPGNQHVVECHFPVTDDFDHLDAVPVDVPGVPVGTGPVD